LSKSSQLIAVYSHSSGSRSSSGSCSRSGGRSDSRSCCGSGSRSKHGSGSGGGSGTNIAKNGDNAQLQIVEIRLPATNVNENNTFKGALSSTGFEEY
jgi:hypothetical protein